MDVVETSFGDPVLRCLDNGPTFREYMRFNQAQLARNAYLAGELSVEEFKAELDRLGGEAA